MDETTIVLVFSLMAIYFFTGYLSEKKKSKLLLSICLITTAIYNIVAQLHIYKIAEIILGLIVFGLGIASVSKLYKENISK